MLTARGGSGEVRKGYQVVARLGAWSLERDRIDAPVSDVNEFWLSQGGPFHVRVNLGKLSWVWREAEVQVHGAACFVRVSGSPDKIVNT